MWVEATQAVLATHKHSPTSTPTPSSSSATGITSAAAINRMTVVLATVCLQRPTTAVYLLRVPR